MLPPGPTAAPAVQTLRWLLRPIAFLEDCRRRFGDAFSVTFLGFETPMVMLSDPEAIRALYAERGHGLPPGRTLSLRPVLGERSVLLLEGREHLERRRVMLPPFHGERMRAYEPIAREAAERELARWPQGAPFPIHPSMQAITLEVILRAVFGVEDPGRRDRLRGLLKGLLDQTSSARLQFAVLAARRLGLPDPLAKVEARQRDLDDLLLSEIRDHRDDPDLGGRTDILSLLVQARFEDGAPMSDREVRDQLVTLLLAGHETTATGLAWTFDLLLRHPHVHDRLVAEARDGAGADVYARAVVSESLRLRPVVPLAGRRLATPLNTGGLDLPAGTDVTPAIWLTHTNPAVYPEPYAFRPERWLDGGAPPTYAWVPFGGGVRRCLGAAFAELEMRVVLQTVLRHRTLRPAATRAEHVRRRNVTFSPAGGTRVISAGASTSASPSA
ncbi:MAG: cytochrome family [Solirubrobacteraceae bacterium]|nr:cytochrome family [Solirubrobacteraceae bacterium]